MMTPLVIFIFISEAFAHSIIIKGLTVCGQDQRDNNRWHTAFSMMWFWVSILLFVVHSWQLAIHLLVSRAFIFPIALNRFRNMPTFYLSDNHYDGFVKKIGTAPYFAIVFVIYLLTIYLLYA